MTIQTNTTAIDTAAAAALVLTGAISEGDFANAIDAADEHEMLCIAHPDPEDQLLHRVGECDGTCTRFACFR